MDRETSQTLSQLSKGETELSIDHEVVFSFHRDPTLLERLPLKRTTTDYNEEIPKKEFKRDTDSL